MPTSSGLHAAAAGSFAVVTAPALPGRAVVRRRALLPLEQAGEVLHAWHEWTSSALEKCSTAARILKFPPLEAISEIVRGKSFTVDNGAVLGRRPAELPAAT
jgi:hypothetical protein